VRGWLVFWGGGGALERGLKEEVSFSFNSFSDKNLFFLLSENLIL
jgi:hypothetical protein